MTAVCSSDFNAMFLLIVVVAFTFALVGVALGLSWRTEKRKRR